MSKHFNGEKVILQSRYDENTSAFPKIGSRVIYMGDGVTHSCHRRIYKLFNISGELQVNLSTVLLIPHQQNSSFRISPENIHLLFPSIEQQMFIQLEVNRLTGSNELCAICPDRPFFPRVNYCLN